MARGGEKAGNAVKHLALVVCFVTGLPACGGGGGTITLPPTITSVTVMPATATVVTGKTATFTATVAGTGNYSPNVTWTASAGTIGSTGVLTAPATAGTVTVTATSTQDTTKSGTATATIVFPLSVSVSATPATVNAGDTTGAALAATVQGGTGNATVAWSVSLSTGTVTSTGPLTATYVPPATVSASTTVTITATATDASGSATGTVSVTVQRVITIALPQPIPNGEIYSDFGMVLIVTIDCTGCQSGDTLNGTFSTGFTSTTPYQSVPWQMGLNSTGNTYVPGFGKFWVSGADGATSNIWWYTFDGSQNMAVEDPSSGEIYYYYAGNGSDGSGEIMKFKPDGTADGNHSYGSGASAIAFDSGTIFLTQPEPVSSTINGIATFDTNWDPGLIPLTNGEPLGIDAKDGLVCVTIPTGGGSPNATDAVDCNDSGVFTVPGISSGSQPTAIRVLDSSHIVFYGRGDQTLRWYTISGTTASASGTLQLSEFSATDANYWKTYPATGGWDLVQVGSTLGIMGQVVNSDGTVGQKLALVNNTNQTLIQSVDLPDGTVHIAADPTNNAIVAEYPDFTVSPPVTRFERIYVDTGNSILLTSTSTLVPGAGFLVTQDGSHIAVFVEGKADFVPNQ